MALSTFGGMSPLMPLMSGDTRRVLDELESYFFAPERTLIPTTRRGMTTRDWGSDNMIMPRFDVIEDKDGFRVVGDIPGMTKDDISVFVDDKTQTLNITGERKQETEVKDETYHRVERSFGRFERRMALPPTADPSKVKADYTNGVLTLNFEKATKPKESVKKIAIS